MPSATEERLIGVDIVEPCPDRGAGECLQYSVKTLRLAESRTVTNWYLRSLLAEPFDRTVDGNDDGRRWTGNTHEEVHDANTSLPLSEGSS